MWTIYQARSIPHLRFNIGEVGGGDTDIEKFALRLLDSGCSKECSNFVDGNGGHVIPTANLQNDLIYQMDQGRSEALFLSEQ